MKYSEFIHGLEKAEIIIDRKVLADFAFKEPDTFKSIVEEVRSSLKTQ